MKWIAFYMYTFVLLASLCPAGSTVFAQAIIKGTVIDRENRMPVDAATVQLTQGNASLPINYTLTDGEGMFTLPQPRQTDSLFVSVSILGYQGQRKAVQAGQPLLFELEPQVFNLKEVEIRPGRVWGRQDTINYDVTQFLSPKDQSIKDVLLKLPGIDIDDLGKISYNGKDISHFYVEGLDLTNGKYKQISENLRADAVQNVQVMENHQPIRVLQKKIRTEDVALNLKLKPEFRDRWLINLEGGLGASPLLWKGGADALQISRKSQSAYLYKGNNTGQDVSGEQDRLTESSDARWEEPEIPGFLQQPEFSAPLKKGRWLFNQIHSLSANRLYKLNEDTQLRINAGYIHDRQVQERGSETSYYQSSDTVHVTEQSNSRIQSDRVHLNIGLESNTQEQYLKNDFSATGNWQSGLSQIMGNFSPAGNTALVQRIRTPELGVRNLFRSLWNRDNHTMEVRSLLRYHGNSAMLRIGDESNSMNLQDFYTDNSISFLRKKGPLTRQYTVGVIGEISNIEKSLQGYLSPDYQWNAYKWTVSLSAPIRWTGYTGVNFSRLSLNPSLSVVYKLNYAWRFTAHASYKERYGDMVDLYDRPWQTNYRNSILNCGILPVNRQQIYSVYGEYKRTASEFFATFNLTHDRLWSNRIFEQRIKDGQIQLVSLPLSNQGSGWSAKGTFSKGFYDWGVKTSLTALLSINKAEQMSEGERLPYQYRFMRYEPKITWTPDRHWEAGYEAGIQYGGSKIGERTRLAPLWNVTQQMRLSYIFLPLEVSCSLDHYHNDVAAGQTVDAVFADLSVGWKSRRWQVMATATNLFDKRTYGYTRYSSLESYTSWVQIRPREFLVSLRYQL
ncbi:carboxypeptidase-like regulatory domain-containing protein [Parabacteroides sp.]